MDHSEAIESNSAEKYLLGELSAEARDEFEEHFFGCAECANDVRAGASLIDNARSVLGKDSSVGEAPIPAVSPQRFVWSNWFKPAWGFAPALAMLLAILAYQNLVTIPSLKHLAQPQTLASYSLVTAGSRGADSTSILAPKDRPFGLYVDIPANTAYSYYTVGVQTASGDRPIHVQVSAEQAKETVQILIPAGALKAGNAELTIEGHTTKDEPTTRVAQYPFVVQYQ